MVEGVGARRLSNSALTACLPSLNSISSRVLSRFIVTPSASMSQSLASSVLSPFFPILLQRFSPVSTNDHLATFPAVSSNAPMPKPIPDSEPLFLPPLWVFFHRPYSSPPFFFRLSSLRRRFPGRVNQSCMSVPIMKNASVMAVIEATSDRTVNPGSYCR
jgi:hypothetical protein